jgi:hypothetical protein
MKAPLLIGIILVLYVLFCGCNTPRAAYNKVANSESLSEKLYEKVLEPRHPCIIKDSVTKATEKEVNDTSSTDYAPASEDTVRTVKGDTVLLEITKMRTITKTINHHTIQTINHYTEDIRDKQLKEKQIAVLNQQLLESNVFGKQQQSQKRKIIWSIVGVLAILTGSFLIKKWIQLHNLKIPFVK